MLKAALTERYKSIQTDANDFLNNGLTENDFSRAFERGCFILYKFFNLRKIEFFYTLFFNAFIFEKFFYLKKV